MVPVVVLAAVVAAKIAAARAVGVKTVEESIVEGRSGAAEAQPAPYQSKGNLAAVHPDPQV